ncbi:ubiquitin-like-specific protease ESD4 [Ditylenchus destructor]|uniref:Ubiquitin-like-specific protease ESD4 n=1 Tax=Ditylenchus destructor TaxID=166010 RepID=A0AAD4MV45_9BILA|nr:ubiquitin-like-specific protease ESD4 [Ditylenchus destructor]
MRTLLSFILLNWLSTYYLELFSAIPFNSANEINNGNYAQYFNSHTDRYRRSAKTQYFGKGHKVWKPVVRELNALRRNVGLPALKWNPAAARDISPKDCKTNNRFSVEIRHPGKTASATLVAAIRQIFLELLYKNVRCKKNKCYAKHRNLRGLSSGLIAWRAKSIVCVAKIYGHKPRASINCQRVRARFQASRAKANRSGYGYSQKPPGFPDLPEDFKRQGIWGQILRQASGEWIRGHTGTVTAELIKSLRDGQWLTSEAIDAYISLLAKSKSTLRFISTAEFMGFDKSGTNNISWKMNGAETVLVPAHINGNHWGMIIVDATNKTLTMMDSLNGGAGSSTKTRILETAKKLIGQLSPGVSFKKFLPQLSPASWTVTEKMDVPQQRNGVDCGVFSLAYAIFAARGEKPKFSQQHIPYFRRKIAYDLLNQIIS